MITSTSHPKTETATESEPFQPWRFIPLAQFEKERPQEPTQEAVRHGLRAVWNRLPGRSGAAEPEIPEEARSLKSAPMTVMDMAAPSPGWGRMGGPGLDQALGGWLEGERAGSLAIVSGPTIGVTEMVQAWAGDQGLQILAPPAPDELLAGREWLDGVLDAVQAGQRLILPGLERCFLRHPEGLDLVRGLLDEIWQGKISCLLTCDSWAWAYLDRVVQVESILPAPLTLSPFDATALDCWFRQLAQRYEPRSLTFRQASDGHPVLTAQKAPLSDPGVQSDQTFLTHLAARSRGNPGVARAIWRESLQVNSTEEVEVKAQEEAAGDRGYTMWVTPWPKLALPEVPPNTGRAEAFVLHALLLHNGLPAWLLFDLLPMGRAEVVQILHRLRTARLVADEGNRWQVTPLGYPAVRSYLGREGFLTDGL